MGDTGELKRKVRELEDLIRQQKQERDEFLRVLVFIGGIILFSWLVYVGWDDAVANWTDFIGLGFFVIGKYQVWGPWAVLILFVYACVLIFYDGIVYLRDRFARAPKKGKSP